MNIPRVPTATYRLQLNSECRFEDVKKIIGYLHELGISDLYLSPITKARKGSKHGYDVTDPAAINPELGTGAEFDTLVEQAKQKSMGILLDIVPNHMATSAENPYWMDFLENGSFSPYAGYFDFTPAKTNSVRKVALPVLGAPREGLIASGQIRLALSGKGCFISYGANKFPVGVRSYRYFSGTWLSLTDFPEVAERLKKLAGEAKRLPPVGTILEDNENTVYRQIQECKSRFLSFLKDPQHHALVNQYLAGNRDLLRRILDEQVYTLVYWKMANRRTSYRRFFGVNDLIGINVQEERVYFETHALIHKLLSGDKVQGLRVDHIDGLYDPAKYLERLQAGGGVGNNFYIVVEKILAPGEELPANWCVSGTTGYDFASLVDGLQVNEAGTKILDSLYRNFTRDFRDIKDTVYEKKKLVIKRLFAGEMLSLGKTLYRLALDQHRHEPGLSAGFLTKAIAEVSASLPVYRTYVRDFNPANSDSAYLGFALRKARLRTRGKLDPALGFIENIFLNTHTKNHEWLDFIMRWQQFTGAITAKGFEDTTLYAYNRLLSLNEVGGNPASPGVPVSDFHHANRHKLERYPHGLNATTTHDTKRSEDVRARIDVLSEQPLVWANDLNRWSSWNRKYKARLGKTMVPERSMEMHIYQTLLGAWPRREAEIPEFIIRVKNYLTKAAREAKCFSSWENPRKDYEEAILSFVDHLFDDNHFLADLKGLREYVAYYGALNSLAQVLLKVGCPGVPDFYQGNELWIFTLVDPDNRQPVDFDKRKQILADLERKENENRASLIKDLVESWHDGRIKLYTMFKALNFRRDFKELFQNGGYIPVKSEGELKENVFAFMRVKENHFVVVAVPIHIASLYNEVRPAAGKLWKGTKLLLPDHSPSQWLNIITKERINADENQLSCWDVFRDFPVAMLTRI